MKMYLTKNDLFGFKSYMVKTNVCWSSKDRDDACNTIIRCSRNVLKSELYYGDIWYVLTKTFGEIGEDISFEEWCKHFDSLRSFREYITGIER